MESAPVRVRCSSCPREWFVPAGREPSRPKRCTRCEAAARAASMRASRSRRRALAGYAPTPERLAERERALRADLVPAPASAPTGAPPGTDEKIAVMAARREAGEHIHHPGDATLVSVASLDAWLDAVVAAERAGRVVIEGDAA